MSDKPKTTADRILDAFNALRAAGAVPNFAPNSEAETGAVRLYGAMLLKDAGLDLDELLGLVKAHIGNPVHNPAFALPWPSPGHLLSYRAPKVPTVDTAQAVRWFDALATAACEARALPRGERSADEVFATRAKRQLGHAIEDLPAPVLAALAEIGGRGTLADEGGSDESRGFLRRRFLKAVQAAEDRERLSPTPAKPAEPAPLLLTDSADPLPPIDFTERVRAMRERLANKRETS